jgi:hypothetical protein
LTGRHRRHHREPREPLNVVTAAMLEQAIWEAYGVAWGAAARFVGKSAAFEVPMDHEALAVAAMRATQRERGRHVGARPTTAR